MSSVLGTCLNKMVGSNSKVGIQEYNDDFLAEISEATYLERQKMAPKTKVVTETEVPVHECGVECNLKFPIHAAAKEGDLSKFKLALENKEKAQKHMEVDCEGYTVLHHVASLDSPTCTDLFDYYQEKFTSDLWNLTYLNAPDPKGQTVLHHAAFVSSPSIRLVEQFLRLGVNDLAVDTNGEIALDCAVSGSTIENFEIVKILLNLLTEADVEKYGPEVLLNVVQSNESPEIIDLLLGRIKSKGIQAKAGEDGDPGFTLLQKSVYWTIDDSPVELDCVRRLLAVLDKEDINAICQRESWRGQSVLQLAATENAFNVLNELIAHEFTDLFIVDTQKRTILHTLADSGWSVAREQSLNALFNSPKLGDKETKIKFLGMKDKNGETALEIAIRRDSVAFSRAILLANPQAARFWLDDALMRKIYEKVPEVMLPLMNSAIQFERKNYEAGDELFETDLGPIIGYGLNDDGADYLNYYTGEEERPFPGFKKETDYLSIILDSPHVKEDERAAILGHPLVALFINEKWKRLDELFWFSFCTNMTLLGLYIVSLIHMFLITCPYVEKPTDEACQIQRWQRVESAIMTSALIALFINKLSVDYVTTGFRNIFKLENLMQLAFIIGVVLITIMVVIVTGIVPWHHWLASSTVLLASFLAFSQLLKIPSLGIYADVFYKVLQKMIRLMLTFCPLLIGFTVAISLILPGNQKFAYLPYNFVKILVMMTGEINFDDVFYSEYQIIFRTYGIILFAVFTVIVSIVIFNLMLGFTISDIQALENESEMQILTNTLGQIVVFERLVFSRLAQKLVPKSFLRRYLVVGNKLDYTSSKDFYRVMDQMPTKLRKSIMELAKDQNRLQQQQHSANKSEHQKGE